MAGWNSGVVEARNLLGLKAWGSPGGGAVPLCLCMMIWLEVRNLVPFPWVGGMGTQVVPNTGSVCSKPRCCRLCTYGCVLGIWEGLPSDWLGR